MKKLMIVAAVAAMVAGCASTTAEWGGEEVVRGADGAPLVDKDGTVQTVGRPVQLSAWRHWFDSEIQTAELSVDGQTIKFILNGYNGTVDTNLVPLVKASFDGAALLTAKVAAAIATSGGSVAAEGGVATLAAKAVKLFSKHGGDADKATVECKDGTCTFTDGSNTVTCKDGTCTYTDSNGVVVEQL